MKHFISKKDNIFTHINKFTNAQIILGKTKETGDSAGAQVGEPGKIFLNMYPCMCYLHKQKNRHVKMC